MKKAAPALVFDKKTRGRRENINNFSKGQENENDKNVTNFGSGIGLGFQQLRSTGNMDEEG